MGNDDALFGWLEEMRSSEKSIKHGIESTSQSARRFAGWLADLLARSIQFRLVLSIFSIQLSIIDQSAKSGVSKYY